MEDLLISLILQTLIAGIPLLFATTGEIITERSGILNLGAEGIMATAAISAFACATYSHSIMVGVMVGMVAGGLMAGIHGLASIYFRANQTVSGLAITMLGLGLVGLWGKPFIGQAATIHSDPWHLPLLGDIPFLGRILNGLDGFFYLSLILTVATWYYLKRTRGGLRLRTCGENPRAAEALGIGVAKLRLAATMVGGVFFGLAGSFLSLSFAHSWTEKMTGGRGWIAVALTIFALWNPLRAFWGAFLFGGIFVLQYSLQPLGIPSNLLGMLPYLTTLVVLILGGLKSDHRLRSAPAALGEVFRPGER